VSLGKFTAKGTEKKHNGKKTVLLRAVIPVAKITSIRRKNSGKKSVGGSIRKKRKYRSRRETINDPRGRVK